VSSFQGFKYPDATVNALFVFFGQLVDHDMVNTLAAALTPYENIMCNNFILGKEDMLPNIGNPGKHSLVMALFEHYVSYITLTSSGRVGSARGINFLCAPPFPKPAPEPTETAALTNAEH
jgi:hypothetical protein